MHDCAPDRFSINARRCYSDEDYPNRWIGQGGPQNWFLRSPELILYFVEWIVLLNTFNSATVPHARYLFLPPTSLNSYFRCLV